MPWSDAAIIFVSWTSVTQYIHTGDLHYSESTSWIVHRFQIQIGSRLYPPEVMATVLHLQLENLLRSRDASLIIRRPSEASGKLNIRRCNFLSSRGLKRPSEAWRKPWPSKGTPEIIQRISWVHIWGHLHLWIFTSLGYEEQNPYGY